MARILHVDDDAEWRELTRKALHRHQVDSAASFSEALEYMRTEPAYDLALVDLNLRGQGDNLGSAILDQLRDQHPSTRRIVITGSPPSGPVRTNMFGRYGVEEIVIKGALSSADLSRVVEDALGQRPAEIPRQLKVRRSELRQRLRDLQRHAGGVMKRRVDEAEDDARDAEESHQEAVRRTQHGLAAAKSLAAAFDAECGRADELVESISSVSEAEAASRALDSLQAIAATAHDSTQSPRDRRVFVVHGHDVAARDQLELRLRRMRLQPIVLVNQPGGGDTIIEALERYLRRDNRIGFACVLLTPDDEGHLVGDPSGLQNRARQNVVMELGMVLARLGRDRVAILHQESVELPSDIGGLICHQFKNRVDEVMSMLFRDLQRAGYDPDPAGL